MEAEDNTRITIRGVVICERSAPAFHGATLYVRLEKVNAADAPSEVLAEYVHEQLSLDPQTAERVAFTLVVQAADLRAHCIVQAHIDVDCDGEISVGDLINMQAYPVTGGGDSPILTVLVREVR